MLKRPSRRRISRHSSLRRRGSSDAKTPPDSPSDKRDLRRISSPLSLRPPIFITRTSRGFGFSVKSIRVYIGQSCNYLMQHLIEVLYNLFFLIMQPCYNLDMII